MQVEGVLHVLSSLDLPIKQLIDLADSNQVFNRSL